jgi:MoaA/NifB/PqqE/SkfB family radical SAM enzyme
MPAASLTTRGPFRKTNRSAFSNFLLAKYEMYKGVVDVRSSPYYITLEPSDLCQLRCPTCVTGIENELRRRKSDPPALFRRDRSKLAPELFGALLDELGDALFLITFYNFGEPLLNRNLPGYIRKAKARNIETDINTNLSLPLSDELIEDLLSSGLDYLFASIDGFSQETYQIHRVGGNFELVKENLERLASARDRMGLDTAIVYNFLVFRFNEHEIGAAKSYCEELGIYFNTREAFIHDPDWVPTHRKEEKPVFLAAELELPAGFGRKTNGNAAVWSPLPALSPRPPGRCSWHYGFSAITAGGKVAPCCMIPHERNDFGSVRPGESRFRDVWNNDLYRRSRADVAGREVGGLAASETICSRCPAPPFLYHMYSLHDSKAIARFHQLFRGSEPLLERAFDLLCRSRYGLSPHQLFSSGAFAPPEQALGTENETEIAKFVQFFEENFAGEIRGQGRTEGSPAPAGPARPPRPADP